MAGTLQDTNVIVDRALRASNIQPIGQSRPVSQGSMRSRPQTSQGSLPRPQSQGRLGPVVAPAKRKAAAARSALQNGSLHWLPPSQIPNPADEAVQSVMMSNWLEEFKEGARFDSPALFLELRLRQALQALDEKTPHATGPDAFRTATVCECLSRLADTASAGLAPLLQLLRSELMHTVYVDYASIEAQRRGAPSDAEQMLTMPTYFAQCAKLRQANTELREMMEMWQQTKLELQQDAEVRADLLKVAVQRWNAVMGSLSGVADASEMLAKVGGALEALRQANQTIDELQRPALTDPLTYAASRAEPPPRRLACRTLPLTHSRALASRACRSRRLHNALNALSAPTRRRTFLRMLQLHGGDTFAAQDEESRLELLHNLFGELAMKERQALLQAIATHEGFAGSCYETMVGLLPSLDTQDGVALLRQQMVRCRALLSNAEVRARPQARTNHRRTEWSPLTHAPLASSFRRNSSRRSRRSSTRFSCGARRAAASGARSACSAAPPPARHRRSTPTPTPTARPRPASGATTRERATRSGMASLRTRGERSACRRSTRRPTPDTSATCPLRRTRPPMTPTTPVPTAAAPPAVARRPRWRPPSAVRSSLRC